MSTTLHQTSLETAGSAASLLAKSLLWGLPAQLGVAAELRRSEGQSAPSGSAHRGTERKNAA